MPLARVRAGIIRRMLATIIDVGAAMLIATLITIAARVHPATGPLYAIGISAALWPVMSILSTWKWRRTLGKWIMGTRLQVFDPKRPDAHLQIGQILLREGFFKAAIPLSFAAYPNAAWMSVVIWAGMILSLRFRIDRRALHDFTTSTQVVRVRGRAARAAAEHRADKAKPSKPLASSARVVKKEPLQLAAGSDTPAAKSRTAAKRSSKKRKKGRRR